jgi:hypothetical protein
MRRGATALISLVLLAVSSAFIYVASIKAAEYTHDQQPQDCPATVSAVSCNVRRCFSADRATFAHDMQVEASSSAFLRGCYCSSLPSTTAIADSVCAVWLQSEGYVLALQNVASLIVAVVNMLLVQALTRLTRFERHHSIDKMQLSLSTRIFLAQFVNTAFLSLVLRADIPFLPSSGIRYSDFEPGWYFTAAIVNAIWAVRNHPVVLQVLHSRSQHHRDDGMFLSDLRLCQGCNTVYVRAVVQHHLTSSVHTGIYGVCKVLPVRPRRTWSALPAGAKPPVSWARIQLVDTLRTGHEHHRL